MKVCFQVIGRQVILCLLIKKPFKLNVFYWNELFTVCKSAFLSGDSCTLLFFSIIHEMKKPLDKSTPIAVRFVFLHISKAFDKVWHKLLVCKISGNLPQLFENYLTDHKQRIVLHGPTSSWERFLSDVLQGLVLELLFLTIYINNLPDRIQSICRIFPNNRSLFLISHNFKQFEQS